MRQTYLPLPHFFFHNKAIYLAHLILITFTKDLKILLIPNTILILLCTPSYQLFEKEI